MTETHGTFIRSWLSIVLGVGILVGLAGTGAVTTLAQESLAIPVTDDFEVTGDAAGDDTLYAWTLEVSDAQWQVELIGPPEEQVALQLLGADGAVLEDTRGTGAATFFDVALVPGTYQINVRRSPRDSLPYTLRASMEPETFDPEPNDSPDAAVSIADGSVQLGRLGRTGKDLDYYRFTVPPGDLSLRDIVLEAAPDTDRTLCLLDKDGNYRSCRRDTGGVELLALLLEPGDHILEVSGRSDPDDPYQLRLDNAGVRLAYEAEPNDSFETASAFEAEGGVSGRSERLDPDFLRVTIEGEPQLWRVEASGPQVDRLSWVRGDGSEVAVSVADRNGSTAQLNDLYLVPGNHVFRVRTLGDDYRLEMTPLGPPDPEAEREPNSDVVRAEPYGIGERKIGRLASDEDLDYFRFTLAAPEHLRLKLAQPADADLELRLTGGRTDVLRQWASEPGAELDLDLWLQSGDYLLLIRPRTASAGEYELTSERADPFLLAADVEPNDGRGFARSAPATLRWSGDAAGGKQDLDGYFLPPLTSPGPISIKLDTERPVVRLWAETAERQRIDLETQQDGSILAADVPLGVPFYLEIQAGGPYQVALDAPGWTATPEPAELSLELELRFDEDTVAAYWPQAQTIEGALEISNSGVDDVELELKALASHYAWDVRPDVTTISVPAGGRERIAMTVEVDPDAWADYPVQVSVAAIAADGGRRTASAVLDASRDAVAVRSHVGWTVPAALLGGLNVAGLALGGEPLGLVEIDRERFLFDDVTPAGAGFGASSKPLPMDLAVDLAGDEPVPIVGTIINPLARSSQLSETPRDFELLLSTDGETWTSVLSAELQPLPIDQSFVLDRPIPATQAMLRIKSLHGGGTGTVSLGEWKVIAQPGVTPDAMPDNIAAPVRGGHVVRHAPFVNGFSQWYRMLDADSKRLAGRIDRDVDDEFEMVVGFQEGRAAQIRGLRWKDPDGSVEETRLSEVDVEVSTEGPLGPWQDAGTWSLERQADGSVAPFELAEPTWARFIRLISPLPSDVREVEFPATVEVIERSTDVDYRSILGEWGYTSSLGPFEQLVPTAIDEVEIGPDAADTREQATPLLLGTVRADRAETLVDEDWYRLEVPEGHNTLGIEVQGVPAVAVGLTLFDADGAAREMRPSAMPGGGVRYEAEVQAGQSYDLRVDQPPFNAVFTFDTSGSMGPFLDFVLEGMREFAADVEPGREAVMIVPFERAPLLDVWQDQPIILEDAVNNFVPANESSNVEEGLLASTELLAGREGTRAILVVTDAETGSLALAPELWAALDAVQPIVYAVHVGASSRPEETRNLMRAWADSAGGVYAYPTTHAAMGRAFERMSTRLRRPATYTLEATTSALNRDPAMLMVSAPQGEPTALAPGVGVEIILDTSGSMRKSLGGKRRIDIAKSSLRKLFGKDLAEGVPLAIRTFGGKSKGKAKAKAVACQTRLSLPLEPLDRDDALALVKALKAEKRTKTPIAAALAEVAGDLADVTGSRTVVLITDGDETCGGDPDAVIEELRATGIDINLNIVGFALDDEELKAQMAAWAEAGDGTYFDAGSAADLSAAISAAVSAPFRVYAPSGDIEPVATGTVGGDAVQLPPGRYRVEVLTDPPFEFEEVELGGGEAVSLVLPGTADES